MAIEIRNLSFSYEPGTAALEDVSLSVEPGEFVALLGHNGSGKSTLVKHLNGLHSPSQGSVEILGTSTEGQTVATMARKVALLFQNPEDQICKRSVLEEVAFGPRNLGRTDDEALALVEEWLGVFGLSSMTEKNPYDLGGSERKRLAIASVLAMGTKIVVLDEPTAGLDPGETEMLSSALHRLREQGKTVVLVTHDMDFVAEHLPRAVCLHKGVTRFDGETTELFARPTLMEECGLLPPQMVLLSRQLGLPTPALTPDALLRAFQDKD